jgi:hypothetical protein
MIFTLGAMTAFAGGDTNVQSSNDAFLSDTYGQYKISYGAIDFSRHDDDGIARDEAADYLPWYFQGWLAKPINKSLDAVLKGKYSYYNPRGFGGSSGDIDDTPTMALSIEALLLKDYQNSTSFTSLQYIREKQDDGAVNNNHHSTSWHGSLGGAYSFNANNTSIIGFGLASNDTHTLNQNYTDEVIYLQLLHNYNFTDNLSMSISHVQYQYESKNTGSVDEDGKDYQHSEIGFSYFYKGMDLGLAFGRIDLNEGVESASETTNKGDSYMFSVAIPFGTPAKKRTNLIMNNRPDIEFMQGFSAGPAE